MSEDRFKEFLNLGFEDFRRRAQDKSLSQYEKIGFPDDYRKGNEQAIFQDILSKLDNLSSEHKTILDIGPGCSDLPRMLIDLCSKRGHKLLLVDSAEMLVHLPDAIFLRKIPGCYPNCSELFREYAGKVDVILCYSVLHYIFAESNLWEFFDRSLELLRPGGQMLIGDIPNVSKRKRFFSSTTGINFHKKFTGKDEDPDVAFHVIEHKAIDDSVMMAMLFRARNAGFDAYVMPQRSDLTMANRREDLLITRP
jgi:cyclopropane fatty-acyl-phospholipid synthase-like methyltransferase